MNAVVKRATWHNMPERPTSLLPREAYVSPDWFRAEQEKLFAQTWSYVGVSTELPNPGDYATVGAGDYRLVVLRDTSGRLRGFHNICRHRGTELLEGAGNLGSERIVCPYHWGFRCIEIMIPFHHDQHSGGWRSPFRASRSRFRASRSPLRASRSRFRTSKSKSRHLDRPSVASRRWLLQPGRRRAADGNPEAIDEETTRDTEAQI